MCFFGCFLCLQEGENVQKNKVERKNQEKKMILLLSEGCWGFLQFRCKFRGGGPSASNLPQSDWSWHFWNGLDFLFLKRYGSWKSNGWIKSDGSQKLVVHRSMRYLGFRDILTVLTPISTLNSRWNENLIIFVMALVSTRSNSRIKIRVFGPTRDRLWVKLGQSY